MPWTFALESLQEEPALESFLQQLPALIGVLLGAVSTFVATTATERSRWRRQQSVRWDADRLAAYSEYARAVKRKIAIAVQIAARRGVHPEPDWSPSNEGIEALTVAEEDRTTKWERVLLLGSNEAVAAAREWHNSVFLLERVASGTRTDKTWTEAVERTSRGRLRFYEVVKRDLGTAVSVEPHAYEWQLAKLVSGHKELRHLPEDG